MKYTGRKRTSQKILRGGVIFIALIIVITATMFSINRFQREHFARNTVIEGVDCSYSSIPKATEKVAEALSNRTITLKFCETEYQLQGKDFGLGLSDSSELEKILAKQQEEEPELETNYTLQNSFKVDEELIRVSLSEIDALKPENMVKPQNAFITVAPDGTLRIESEVLGNEIDFDEAVAMCTENLLFGKDTIDFNSILKIPEILSTDPKLNENVNEVNQILSTVIDFELRDGSVFTLDKEIMKDWVSVDDEGHYYVDYSNVDTFVQELDEMVQTIPTTVTFTPSGCNYQVSVPVYSGRALAINTKAEAEQIREELATSGTYSRKPIYKYDNNLESALSYVEIDRIRQKVWLYYEGVCILDGVPCVTGNKGNHDTDLGLFYLTSKSTNAILRGWNDDGTRYASKVAFWMPFNGGIGMHDASWRHGVFGGTLYQGNGSHGCVNMRYEDAKTMYEYITYTMPIIVYESYEVA